MQIRGALIGAGATLAVVAGGFTAAAIANANGDEPDTAPSAEVSSTPSATPTTPLDATPTTPPSHSATPSSEPTVNEAAPVKPAPGEPAPVVAAPEADTQPPAVSVPEPSQPSAVPTPVETYIVNGVPVPQDGSVTEDRGTNGYSDIDGNWITVP